MAAPKNTMKAVATRHAAAGVGHESTMFFDTSRRVGLWYQVADEAKPPHQVHKAG